MRNAFRRLGAVAMISCMAFGECNEKNDDYINDVRRIAIRTMGEICNSRIEKREGWGYCIRLGSDKCLEEAQRVFPMTTEAFEKYYHDRGCTSMVCQIGTILEQSPERGSSQEYMCSACRPDPSEEPTCLKIRSEMRRTVLVKSVFEP